MDSYSLKCFGVGDGWPCADRYHSSFLYRFGETSLLVDCGEPLSRSYKELGLPYDTIDRIFLSHLHFDHVGGLFMFIQGLWLEQRRKQLPFHLPEYGIEPIRKMLEAGCIFEELLPFKLDYLPLRAGEPILTGKVRTTAYPTTHLEGLRKAFGTRHPANTFSAFCFLMECGDLRIGHSADLGSPTDLEPILAQPLDLLVCELAHFEPEELLAYLKGRKIKRIAFTHLARAHWGRFSEIREQAQKILGNCDFLIDGTELVG